VQSVVEGEATVLMFDASLRSFKSWGIGAAGGKDFDIRSFVMESMLAASKHHKNKGGKNAVFVEDLLFPYVWGGVFIQHIVNTRGWEAVNTFYSDLPVSSEQIMHPEKYYISRDLPRKVNIPDISKSLNPQRTLLLKNTLGEFGFYLVGKNFLDELSVKVMSEGWAGDTYELYEDTQSKKLLFVSLAEWDSEGHASEMFSFYRDILKKKYPDLSVVKESANAAQYKSGNECIYLARWQDKVLIIEGAEEQELQLLIGAFNLYE
jgi:hypothetical protein